MSAAIAVAPSPAPHERPSFSSTETAPSDVAGSAKKSGLSRQSAQRTTLAASSGPNSKSAGAAPQKNGEASNPRGGLGNLSAAKSSPGSTRSEAGRPKVMVKKEPGSPTLSNMKPRPRKLDLSKNTLSTANNPASAVPMSARDNLGIQEAGIACLSPGFVTQDPIMKSQLQRSISVREQQRCIIEQRLQQQSAKGDGPSDKDKDSISEFEAKTPGMSRRGKAPPGLSIMAPSHEQFTNERVIQSAPLGRSFTGHQHAVPLSRHVANQPSHLSSSSHIHHVPAHQTNNRLPPISDVFGHGATAHPDNAPPAFQRGAPLPSPSRHQASHQQAGPGSGRPREYKSAEEAQQELAGGRPELLPKIVHYGGHQQPPTPPSPAPGLSRHADGSRSANKRRTRAEYEDGASPPLGYGPSSSRRGPFGEGRDSPETQRAKKDEFLRLCSRAWELFHS